MSDSRAEEITVEEKKPTPPSRRVSWAQIGVFFSTLAIVIIFCAFAYGYFQLSTINIFLAETVTKLQKQAATVQTAVEELKNEVVTLEQNEQKRDAIFNTQAETLAEWRSAQKGNIQRWQIAEAEYLVKIANDQLQFTGNISLAMTMLQSADQILAKVADPDLLPVRRMLAEDYAKLQTVPEIDISGLYLRLLALNKQIEQLPLPLNIAKTGSVTQTSEPLTSIKNETLPWWRAGFQSMMQALRQIVIIRYNPAKNLPLVLPEDKALLYQNLHAQLQNIMWATLQRNNIVYESGLDQTILWIQQYFVQDAPLTKAFVQNLNELKNINLELPRANLSATLKLFEDYLAQGAQKTA